MRFINQWNSLSEEIVSSDTVLKFKFGLDKFLLSDKYNLRQKSTNTDYQNHRNRNT